MNVIARRSQLRHQREQRTGFKRPHQERDTTPGRLLLQKPVGLVSDHNGRKTRMAVAAMQDQM